MDNKVSKKKDILTAFMVTNAIKDSEYPINCLEIYYSFSRLNSNLTSLTKNEIEKFLNEILKTIRTNRSSRLIEFGTIGFEVWTGSQRGEHEFNIKFNLVGKDVGSISIDCKSLISNKLIPFYGGDVSVKSKKLDKIGLSIDIVPLNLDIQSFILQIGRSKDDKIFYSEDLIKCIFLDLQIIGKEDILDPLFIFKIP